MKMLNEMAVGRVRRWRPNPRLIASARRRLERFNPITNDFELSRLRDRLSRLDYSPMRSDCLKAIHQLTLVDLNKR